MPRSRQKDRMAKKLMEIWKKRNNNHLSAEECILIGSHSPVSRSIIFEQLITIPFYPSIFCPPLSLLVLARHSF